MKHRNRLILIVLVILLICIPLLNNKKEGFEERQIPLNLFQTWETMDLPPKMKELVETIKKDNPAFYYELFDDSKCAKFIQTYFEPDVLKAYISLVPGAYKADLWRYCVLYIHGGIYMDIKLRPVNGFKLSSVIDKEYFVRDRNGSTSTDNNHCVWNGFMVCYPGSDICKKAIDQIVKNVNTGYYGINPLYPTGPCLLMNYFSQSEILSFPFSYKPKEGSKNYSIIDKSGNDILITDEDVYNEQKQFSNIKYYDTLWREKNIYQKST